MDQGKQARRVLSIRVSEEAYKLIAARAEREDIDASHMARRMLQFALVKMPDYWVPPKR